jgi:hypothetical protein
VCVVVGRVFTAKVALSRPEALVLQFLGGAAVLSFVQFWIVLFGLAYWQTFAIVGVASIAAGLRIKQSYQHLSTRIPAAYWALFAAFGLYYFLQALKPEASPDGATYHLGWVAQTFREHGFHAHTENFYWAFPKGLEMLFLYAFAFGKHSAAALVHFAFLIALAAAVILYARRHDQLLAGVFASLLVFLSPAVALDGTTAYADVALAAAAFGSFRAVDLWKQTGCQRLLLLAATLAGFSFTIKYTGLLVVAYVLIVILIRRASLYAITPALLLTSLYLVRNWLVVGNPVSPFLNSWFPNPHVHVAFETMIRGMMRRYPGIDSYWSLPWETTVRGVVLQGFLGPVFLLLPLSLLALRTPLGRTIMIAGAVFALAVTGNIGTRFWIPSLPFFALGLGLVISRWPALTACIVAFHAITALPPVARLYTAPGAPMLSGLPIRTTLPELTDSYDVVRIIQKHVPANVTVFALAWVMEAYTTPNIRTHHLSAANERLAETLWTPVTEGLQPGKRFSFTFPKRAVTSIRITQTDSIKPDPTASSDKPGFMVLNKPRVQSDQWAINELRVFSNGKQIPQSAGWKVYAQPNPWDAPLAFDKNPTTAWKTWEPTKPGMYFELDFGRLIDIDAVTFDSPNAQAPMRFEWNGAYARQSEAPLRPDLRSLATAALRREGIGYVLIDPTLFGAEDFKSNQEAWRMRFVDKASNGVRLYQLQ